MPSSNISFSTDCFSSCEITAQGSILLKDNYNTLVDNGDVLSDQISTGQISTDSLLQNNIPLNQSFIYKIEEIVSTSEIEPNETKRYEVGVGTITETNGSYYLNRTKHIYQYSGFEESKTNSTTNFFSFDGLSGYLVVSAITPESIIDYFIEDYSALVCNTKFIPTPVQLGELTLLGRLNGNVQSINATELRQILTDSTITGIIESATGNYSFSCQTLNLANSTARLSSASLQARPVYNNSNRPTPQRGMIIYNDQTNRLEVYNGTDWKSVKWTDE